MYILVVEDEQSIADNILYALKRDGFEAEHVLLGNQALAHLLRTSFDLVILDVGLPDINGFELCKKIRHFSDVPIIFLTARDHEVDRVVGLEIGGDDYLTKPFSLRELVARIKVILRRASKQVLVLDSEVALALGTEAKLRLFKHDQDTKRLHYCGKLVDLTPYEYGLLTTLYAHPERVFSREQLIQAVWPDTCESFDRVVDTHIKSLRAKLRHINAHHEPIRTHRSLGYSLSIYYD